MRLFNRVAVIGTGLIGGSLALAIKKNGLAVEVVGVSRKVKNIASAKKLGAIDRGSQSLEIIKGADCLIFATPVNTILKLAPAAARFVSSGCLVTDVASTKEKVVHHLEKLFPGYVGSHPLAGSEKRGIAYASADLFRNSLCIITPTKNSCPCAVSKVKRLWRLVFARTKELTPRQHDRILAFVSHLPHIVAFTLIDSVPASSLLFAASGLKDTTRIAASESELWADILLSNQKYSLWALRVFKKKVTDFERLLTRRNYKAISAFLARAKIKREGIDR